MGLWKRFKRAVTRIFSGGGGSSSRRVVNNRDSRRVTSSNTSARRAYINAYKGERDDLNRGSSISDAWEKTRKAFKASSSEATSDPKEKLRQSARENRKKETKDWYKATNQKYNVSGAKDKAEELKRRQAVKSRAFDASTAVKEEKHELKYHPYAYSAARRGARGLSLTGELLEKKGTKGEAKKAQQYFEKNQNKVAGGIGEAAGTMAAFALTANPSKAVVKKALPKAVRVSAEKGGEKLAARLAEKKLIRKAAEKEVKNAVKKGLTKEVTKEAIDKVARQKAKETVANLGVDFAQNITTGAINGISRASANHKVGSKGWRRELAASGAMNFGLGGAATVGVPALGKGIKRALGGVSEGAEGALKGLSKNSDVKVSLNRKRKTDVRLAKAKEPTVKIDLGRKRNTDVRLPNKPNYWYHAGDLGKAEWHGNQAGSRRGTGHFGTGTYLAGSEDILKREGYGSRPLWSVDASKYNTYRPKDYTQGLRVHDNLKKMNRESGDIDSFVKRARIKDDDLPKLAKELDDAKTTKDLEDVAGKIFSKKDLEAIGEAAEERLKHWRENNVNPDYHTDIDIDEELDEMLADADLSDLFLKGDDNDIDRLLDEAAKRSAEKRAAAVEVPLATYEQAYKAELSDAIGKTIDDLTEYGNETSNALRELGEDLGATPEQIDNALAKTQEIIDAYDRNQVFVKEDSASTIFMKALGYEGVDVRGIEGLDNTEIGSVIYDLRPEDARLIREGKPRKATPPKAIVDEVAEATAKAGEATPNDWRAALAEAYDLDEFIEANKKNKDLKAFALKEKRAGLERLWRELRIAKQKENIHEISLDEAMAIKNKAIPKATLRNWFANEDSNAKPLLLAYIARDPDAVNAGLNIAYHNYADSAVGEVMPFDEWLVTPQTLYRGTWKKTIDDDIFSAFSPDIRVAKRFAGGSGSIDEITVRPIDTWGGYDYSGEQEIFVPQDVINAAKQGADTNAPTGASIDVPDEKAYNEMRRLGNEAEVGDIRTAQAGGETVPSVDGEISTRGGADNGGVERIADASSDEGRRSGVGVLRVSPSNRAKLTESGVTDTRLSDVSDDYATFSNALEAAKEANGHGGWVDSQTAEDLAKGKAQAFLSDDGYAGVAVKEDGDICGVFKHPDSKHRGAAYDLVFTARANGGTKMDCFGKGLVNRYESVGYVPVARLDFNPEYVDDPRLIKEAPDVYVLMKNTDDLDTVASKIKKPESEGGYHRSTQEELDNLPSFGDDYDAALAYRDKMLAEQTAAESPFPYEGTPEAEALVRGQQSAPLSVDEMAGVDEAMPSTNPRQTTANETMDSLERRVAQIAEEPPKEADDSLKINAGEEATVGGRPSGVRQVRSAYEYNNGEPIEDGILTSWNEAWQASKEYSASHARGNKSRMSKVAVSELNAMDSDAERELRQRLADSGELNYDAISTPELYDKIAKQMRDDPDRWVKDMIDINQGGALDFRSTPEWQARVQYIMGTVDPSADEASEIAYTEAFKLAQNISSKGGQTLNLRRNFVHLTPMGKRDAILDDFVNILSKSKGFQKNHPQMRTLGHFDRRNYIRNVLMEDDAIRDGVEKLVNTDDPNAVGDAFTELMYNVNKKNPKSGFDVLQELRYLNMLGNPKTHIRNIFGSGFFIPIREASNSIRSLIEKPIEKWASQYGKFDVTKHGAVWQRSTPEAKSAADEAFEALKNDVLGSAKYETVSYKGRGKTKLGRATDWLSDFNSTLLTKEDDAFRTRAFKNSYAKSYSRYQRDGKPITDKIKRKIEQEAIRESQVATFNEYNSFASFLNNITRKATDAEASTGARWGGRALNAVMPFTKVPANLMNQSLNYSPLGLARGMANIKTAAKTGDSAALNTAIDQLASGMTGSAVFGLGMLLGKTTDMFTTNAGKNDPAAKFKKGMGMQNYSVTFKDPETGQGYSFTLDWLVPTSATFFSGVEMANQLKKGDFNVLDIGGDWSSVVSRLAEPVMETSMLSGLHGMLETMRGGSNADDDKGAISILLRETVQSYMNSIVPTLAGQISRTAYKSDMQIVGDTDWEYWRNQMKSKAGLANTNILGEALGADTDAYGNVKGEKKNGADYAKSALKNFLSPANIQKVDFSKVDDEKLRVYEEAVKNGADPEEMAYLFPKKQYKKQFKVAGEEIKMSNKDVSTYNQAKTTGGEEGMRYILENIMFNRQTLNENGDKVPADSAYTKEQKQALMNEFKGKSMREVEEWLYSQPEFKTATDAEKKKAINGLWTLDSMFDSKANASRRVGEQAVYKAQGKDVNEYNFKNEVSEKKRKALEPLVEAGVVSYEEAVDFARNAGKTYYYENEDGGQSATYYNKKEMIQYLIDKGYSYEKAEALFNAFKAPKAKPYSGNNLSSGKGRRGRRGYRRRGGGGSSKTVKTSVPIKASDYKASKGTYKDMASALQVRSTSKRKTSTKSTAVPKITPPKVKFKKYEV